MIPILCQQLGIINWKIIERYNHFDDQKRACREEEVEPQNQKTREETNLTPLPCSCQMSNGGNQEPTSRMFLHAFVIRLMLPLLNLLKWGHFTFESWFLAYFEKKKWKSGNSGSIFSKWQLRTGLPVACPPFDGMHVLSITAMWKLWFIHCTCLVVVGLSFCLPSRSRCQCFRITLRLTELFETWLRRRMGLEVNKEILRGPPLHVAMDTPTFDGWEIDYPEGVMVMLIKLP